ncbi:MAG: hypothetical protein HeimC2_09900 [Candidatus Heimdallarchaeota archaeon LC_2]|nr:MAG: hypothetical protein HeimC2_30510 [Candidatus Heimdallarchaeota archaeon LC_2]OLS27797.1 MAG: hypothetical protein HeimC2_09900 [Candidatus Heimdallarchaeota archaeon LC_2]
MIVDNLDFQLPLNVDIYALIESLIQGSKLTSSELIELGIFLYHPDIFVLSKIDLVKLWLFLDKNEQRWLQDIAEYLQISEEKVLLKLIELNEKEKTIYQ